MSLIAFLFLVCLVVLLFRGAFSCLLVVAFSTVLITCGLDVAIFGTVVFIILAALIVFGAMLVGNSKHKE